MEGLLISDSLNNDPTDEKNNSYSTLKITTTSTSSNLKIKKHGRTKRSIRQKKVAKRHYT